LVSAPENESGCSCFGEFFDYVMKIQLQKGFNQKFRFNILENNVSNHFFNLDFVVFHFAKKSILMTLLKKSIIQLLLK
jgi:hypothetical protein